MPIIQKQRGRTRAQLRQAVKVCEELLAADDRIRAKSLGFKELFNNADRAVVAAAEALFSARLAIVGFIIPPGPP